MRVLVLNAAKYCSTEPETYLVYHEQEYACSLDGGE